MWTRRCTSPFGQRQINEFQTEINQYQVVLELDTQQRGKAESLNYFLPALAATNEMVPLNGGGQGRPAHRRALVHQP